MAHTEREQARLLYDSKHDDDIRRSKQQHQPQLTSGRCTCEAGPASKVQVEHIVRDSAPRHTKSLPAKSEISVDTASGAAHSAGRERQGLHSRLGRSVHSFVAVIKDRSNSERSSDHSLPQGHARSQSSDSLGPILRRSLSYAQSCHLFTSVDQHGRCCCCLSEHNSTARSGLPDVAALINLFTKANGQLSLFVIQFGVFNFCDHHHHHHQCHVIDFV